MDKKTIVAAIILEALSKQRFADWYTTKFDRSLVGDPDAPTETEILEDIVKLLRVEEMIKKLS